MSGRGFFHNIAGQNREIEHITADEPNILSYLFMMEIKKKDGGAYEPTLASFQRSQTHKFLESPLLHNQNCNLKPLYFFIII